MKIGKKMWLLLASFFIIALLLFFHWRGEYARNTLFGAGDLREIPLITFFAKKIRENPSFTIPADCKRDWENCLKESEPPAQVWTACSKYIRHMDEVTTRLSSDHSVVIGARLSWAEIVSYSCLVPNEEDVDLEEAKCSIEKNADPYGLSQSIILLAECLGAIH